jgi:hypothetical protein
MFAPRWRSLIMGLLLASLVLPAIPAAPAAASAPSPGPTQASDLAAKVQTEAAVIHQLTEQLDQARLSVDATSARLVTVTRQHDATVAQLGANRSVLLEQAVRAYMLGGATAQSVDMSGSADVTLGSEYLRVASGDLVDTGDQLRQTADELRSDQLMLQGAQQASAQATAQLQVLRTNALSIAANEQAQLQTIQLQLDAKTQAKVSAPAGPTSAAPAPTKAATQGGPVNNGLVAVVQQAAGSPPTNPAAPPTTVAPAPPPASSSGGGNAGGVWLELRRCESGDNYAENTGNGFYGAYQFSQSTWSGLGYPGRPDLESPGTQDQAAMKLQAQSGWGQWPACSAALGLT